MACDFKELIAWQKAMELAEATYRIVKFLPKEELYSLSDQMRRAAVSIPSNIAEGQARSSNREFLQFLSIASGSRSELETQVFLCEQIGYFSNDMTQEIHVLLSEVGKLLGALKKKLRSTTL